MALAFADILQQSRKAVRSNPDWLGSEAHRALLGDALAAAFGLADASLEWAPPGEAGYWEAATQRIALERPTLASGLPAEDLAELTALSLLHESLHAHYSTPSGSYTTRLQAVPGQVRRATDRLFNVLEDGRIAAVGAAADPTLDAPLRRFADAAVLAAAKHAGRNGQTVEPLSERNQLFFAIESYALAPDTSVTLHPNVSAALARLTPAIDRTRTGTTEDCGLAAVQLVDEIMRASLQS